MGKGNIVKAFKPAEAAAAARVPNLGMFSVLDELIQNAPNSLKTVEDWQKFLVPGRIFERSGVKFPLKAEELQYAKLGDALGSNLLDPVDRQALLEKIRSSRPIFSVTLGTQAPSVPPAAYTQDLENLRQATSQLRIRPAKEITAPWTQLSDLPQLEMATAKYDRPEYSNFQGAVPGSYEESVTSLRDPSNPDLFYERERSHYPSDTLSWSRSTQHSLPEDQWLRYVEEIQSDVHSRAAEKVRDPNFNLRVNHFLSSQGVKLQAEDISDKSLQHKLEALRSRLSDRIDRLNEGGDSDSADNLISEAIEADDLMEEIESGAHQRRRGYRGDPAAWEKWHNENLVGKPLPEGVHSIEGLIQWSQDQYRELTGNQVSGGDQVANFPFKNPRDYSRLELKKQLLAAANEESDFLGLTTGAEQAKRWRMEPDSPRAEGTSYLYDRIAAGELESLARQYGAQMKPVPAPGGNSSITTLSREVFAEPSFEDYASQLDDGLSMFEGPADLRDIAHSPNRVLGNLMSYYERHQIAMPEEVHGVLIKAQKQADVLEEAARRLARKMEGGPLELSEDSPEMLALSLVKEKTLEKLSDLWRAVREDHSSSDGGSQIQAMELTPTVRQRIKDAGVPLWTLPTAAVGAASAVQDEPQGYDKGGLVSSMSRLKKIQKARLERALDEEPRLEKLMSTYGLIRMAKQADPVVLLDPGEFRKLAHPFSDQDPIPPLGSPDYWNPQKYWYQYEPPMQDRLRAHLLQQEIEKNGLNEPGELGIKFGLPGELPFIFGHEGRHRSLAFEGLGAKFPTFFEESWRPKSQLGSDPAELETFQRVLDELNRTTRVRPEIAKSNAVERNRVIDEPGQKRLPVRDFKPGRAFAEGGPVSESTDIKTLRKLNDLAEKFGVEEMAPYRKRVMSSFLSNIYGLDEKTGQPTLDVLPHLELGDGDPHWTWNPPGVVDSLGNALEFFQMLANYGEEKLGGKATDMLPEFVHQAARRNDELSKGVREWSAIKEASTPGEHLADALGLMLGQVPISMGASSAGKAGKIAGSIPEFFLPTIDPKIENYLAGTLAGGGLGVLAQKIGGGPTDEDFYEMTRRLNEGVGPPRAR